VIDLAADVSPPCDLDELVDPLEKTVAFVAQM